MPPVGFEPKISASVRPQTYTLDRAATCVGGKFVTVRNKFSKIPPSTAMHFATSVRRSRGVWVDLHVSLCTQQLSNASKQFVSCRGQLKCDGTRAETRFRLSAKRTSPFKSAGRSVQSTTDNRGVRISGSNAGYTVFRGSVKGTGYPLHSPVSPSLSPPSPAGASSCVITFQLESIYLYFVYFGDSNTSIGNHSELDTC